MTNAIRLILLSLMLATGCASFPTNPRLADNPNLAPMRVDADENGVRAGLDVAGGGNPFKRVYRWASENPVPAALTVGGLWGLYEIGDHNDWFRGNSKGDRKATYYHIENHGDNNRYIFVSDQGTGSASGDSNTGSGGQSNAGQ